MLLAVAISIISFTGFFEETADIWYIKGTVFDTIGKSEEAVEAFDRVFEIDPEKSCTWHGNVISLHKMSRYDDQHKLLMRPHKDRP